MSFALEQKDEIAYQYCAVHACLDATDLKIYSGFSFDGREYLLSSPVSELREGWYLSVEGMYRFWSE